MLKNVILIVKMNTLMITTTIFTAKRLNFMVRKYVYGRKNISYFVFYVILIIIICTTLTPNGFKETKLVK